MLTKWKKVSDRGVQVLRTARTMGYVVAMALVPVIARAQQDADDKPVPLDPQTAAAQNRTIGIIVLLIVLFIGWYWFRRWQIVRAASHQGDRQE